MIIVERVKDLVDFRNVPRNGRWGFAQTDSGRARHQDEHTNWGLDSLCEKLQKGISDFYKWSKDSLGSPLIISINDMSLPYGGRFDADGLWKKKEDQKHLYHRLGEAVDINRNCGSNRLLKDGDGNWTKFGEALRNILSRYNLEEEPEETIHFQLKGFH